MNSQDILGFDIVPADDSFEQHGQVSYRPARSAPSGSEVSLVLELYLGGSVNKGTINIYAAGKKIATKGRTSVNSLKKTFEVSDYLG